MDINSALDKWITVFARNKLTMLSYRHSNEIFFSFNKFPKGFDASSIKLNHFSDYVAYLQRTFSANTCALYATGVSLFLRWLISEDLSDINAEAIKIKKKERLQKPGFRFPQFPIEDIDKILTYFETIYMDRFEDDDERLRYFRDKALILTLADTGLRIHEACGLKRGDIDFFEGRALVIGKGNREGVVRFSERSMRAIKDYFAVRHELDGKSGRQLKSLPLFARHNLPSRKKVHGITTDTGRSIVSGWVSKILGDDKVGTVTPHSFRHYFVTVILKQSDNLKLAQELARHVNIQVTQRYAHLSDADQDQAYKRIFDHK